MKDAVELTAVQNENFEHLQPWMPWSNHHYMQEEMEARILSWAFLWPKQKLYGIFSQATGEILGEVGLHPRPYIQPDSPCMLSYWLAKRHEGKGYVREAVGALTLGSAAPFYIYVEPLNHRSVRTAELLGFREVDFVHPWLVFTRP